MFHKLKVSIIQQTTFKSRSGHTSNDQTGNAKNTNLSHCDPMNMYSLKSCKTNWNFLLPLLASLYIRRNNTTLRSTDRRNPRMSYPPWSRVRGTYPKRDALPSPEPTPTSPSLQRRNYGAGDEDVLDTSPRDIIYYAYVYYTQDVTKQMYAIVCVYTQKAYMHDTISRRDICMYIDA